MQEQIFQVLHLCYYGFVCEREEPMQVLWCVMRVSLHYSFSFQWELQ